jgi:hypothetical protein
MHKVYGWILREAGKLNRSLLERFQRQRHANVPRTTLGYYLGKSCPSRRMAHLTGVVG